MSLTPVFNSSNPSVPAVVPKEVEMAVLEAFDPSTTTESAPVVTTLSAASIASMRARMKAPTASVLSAPKEYSSPRLMKLFFTATPAQFSLPGEMLSYCSSETGANYFACNRDCQKLRATMLMMQLRSRRTIQHKIGFGKSTLVDLQNCVSMKTVKESIKEGSDSSRTSETSSYTVDSQAKQKIFVGALIKHCHDLTHISFPRYFDDKMPTAIELIRNSPNVTRIDLPYLFLTDKTCENLAKAIRAGGLLVTNLNLEGSSTKILPLTDTGLKFLLQACPHLVSLNINERRDIASRPLTAFAEGCPSLTSLNCRNLSLKDCDVENIANACPELNNVDFEGAYKITFRGFKKLAEKCIKLNSVNFSYCKEFTDECLEAIIERLPHLESIDCSSCKKLTEAGYMQLARCPNLTYIKCGFPLATTKHPLTDHGLGVIARGCPSLTTFNGDYCTELTDSGLVELSESCPNITTISCRGCPKLTYAGLAKVVSSRPHLKIEGIEEFATAESTQ